MLVPLEPPPARELPIQPGHFAKVLPNGMCMEVLYHGHLLSGVPRPDTGTLFAVVEFVRHAAGDSAAIEHAASEAPKPRDGACAHLLSSVPKAQCQNKNPEAGGPQGFGRCLLAISACLYLSVSLPIPAPSSDEGSSSRAALHFDRQQGYHELYPPYEEALYCIAISVQAKSRKHGLATLFLQPTRAWSRRGRSPSPRLGAGVWRPQIRQRPDRHGAPQR